MKPFGEIVSVENLLSPHHRSVLSQHAKKLYTLVWNRMYALKRPVYFLTDLDASVRARILLPYVAGARDELTKAGLMSIRSLPSKHIKDTVFRYEYLEDTA